ncbi:MAG: hypothetical protein JF888_09080 [Candidatus Dormibacteraeota bacterium]|uniref:Uncharacterized protein n=1 Tax=Candidatus Dormiibacter inghamiae TaxID=3127013 RepID=A0A934KII5_9BACT|nr:hypothetical protein [Candidatus Dormibacteraeota bacterium]MBJ7606525.1 hypothetical protein [Candidatus Dormibacteraeota bacterium]
MREMRIRKPPFVVLLVLELAVVAGLGYVAVHLWQQRGSAGVARVTQPLPSAIGSDTQQPSEAPPIPSASPSHRTGPAAKPRQAKAPSPAPPAGISKQQVGQLNREEARWEASEWRILSQATRAAEEYLRKVVLPIVVATERR